MSVPFSGLNVTVDHVATSVSDYLDAINAALVSVNWGSVAAGGGYDVTSAATPQGLQVTVQFRISGNDINATVTNTATGTQFAPALRFFSNPQPTRIVASPYQFFVYVPGSSPAFQEFMVGVPFIPTFLEPSTTEAWWAMNKRDVALATFRQNVIPSAGKQAAFNGTITTDSEQNSHLQIIPPRSVAGGNPSEILWYDGSCLDAECLIAYPVVAAGDQRAIGVMWDMLCIWDAFTWDDEQSFGGKTWVNLSSDTMTPSLWLVKD